jgi:hypothetical protein
LKRTIITINIPGFCLPDLVAVNGIFLEESKVGIQPELIAAIENLVSKYHSSIKVGYQVNVRIDVIEPMGNETYLYASAGGH